ncbi:MAG: hypothetical protein WCJ66_11825 [Verrucomicrobiota bacterium]
MDTPTDSPRTDLTTNPLLTEIDTCAYHSACPNMTMVSAMESLAAAQADHAHARSQR